MPCTYEESPAEIKAQKDAANKRLIAPWKRKLNRTTRLLCEVMTTWESSMTATSYEGIAIDMEAFLGANTDLQKWWADHKKADAKRKNK